MWSRLDHSDRFTLSVALSSIEEHSTRPPVGRRAPCKLVILANIVRPPFIGTFTGMGSHALGFKLWAQLVTSDDNQGG
jgi:hypothetical protein